MWDVEILKFGGELDHVHLLLSMHPNVMPSKLVNSIKTVTSRLLRKEFKEHLQKFFAKSTLWTRAYCLITAGGAPIEILKRYIEQQGNAELQFGRTHSLKATRYPSPPKS